MSSLAIIDRVRSALGLKVKSQASSSSPYEGASTGRRARLWRAPTIGPNSGVLGSLALLRDRSRQAVRNDGYARSAIDRLVSNIIGTGIKPMSQVEDPELRVQIHALWYRWTDESDADELLDYYGQQALAVRTWLEGGELFVRIRPRLASDNLSVPLQLQMLEPELVPLDHNATSRTGNRIRAGIEFTPIGSRAAYWMFRSRPGDSQDMDVNDMVRVPADSVIHMYDPVRPGQIRGLPHLTQALIRLWELDKFDDATLLRQQISNLFVGFVTQETPVGDVAMDPLTGQAIATEDGRGLMSLEPGLFQELPPGQKVEFSDPPSVGQTYADFVRQQMMGISAAVDVPYEVLTGDLTRVNDRTVRIILNEFRRRVTQRQYMIVVYQLCRPIWEAWFDRAVLSGALPISVADYVRDPEAFYRVKWIPQGWAYIHPVQDVQAHRDAVRAGFESRSAVVSEQGEDVEVVDAEIAKDNARADELGLKLDSDGRNPVKASSAPAPEPSPAPSQDPQPQEAV